MSRSSRTICLQRPQIDRRLFFRCDAKDPGRVGQQLLLPIDDLGGVQLKCWHGSATVLSSRSVVKATFALNSGLNTPRLRRPANWRTMACCPSTLAEAKSPNHALIRRVQFCRATSRGLETLIPLIDLMDSPAARKLPWPNPSTLAALRFRKNDSVAPCDGEGISDLPKFRFMSRCDSANISR